MTQLSSRYLPTATQPMMKWPNCNKVVELAESSLRLRLKLTCLYVGSQWDCREHSKT